METVGARTTYRESSYILRHGHPLSSRLCVRSDWNGAKDLSQSGSNDDHRLSRRRQPSIESEL